MLQLSIITITFNAERFIERTLKSIVRQTSQDFEYLVIDGGSKDKTLNLLEKYRRRVDYMVSEPDAGLYDAMNKGLEAAKGAYVWFMNAGDEIADSQAVATLLLMIERSKPDVIYSDTFMVNEKGEMQGLRSELTPHKLPRVLSWKKFNRGMLVCHQSFVARKAICPKYISNNLSADIDWEINCLKRANTVVAYPGILSKYLLGGISTQQHRKSLTDRYIVLKNHFGFWRNLQNHLRIVVRSILT